MPSTSSSLRSTASSPLALVRYATILASLGGALSPSTARAEPTARAEAPAVVVRGEREELGTTLVKRSETRLVAGAFADPFRAIEALPGVAPITSGLPYFVLRGAPPGNTGYYIDGIRVPMLFHVGAGPSVMAPGLVDHVDLFASAYPAAWGRHVAGIISGETTAPRSTGRGEFQARLFDASALVEQPFDGGRGSALVAGRYGYAGALLSKVAPDYALGYADYQARVSHAVGDHAAVSVFAFGGYDRLDKTASPQVLHANLYDVAFHRLDVRLDHADRRTRARLALTLGLDRAASADEHVLAGGNAQRSRSARLRGEVAHVLGEGIRVRAGGDVGVEDVDVDRTQIDASVRAYAPHTDPFGCVYGDLVLRLSRDVQLVPGARLDLLRARPSVTPQLGPPPSPVMSPDAITARGPILALPQPRVAARFRVTERIATITALGLATQMPTSTVFAPGKDLIAYGGPRQEAYQASQALDLLLGADLSARATVFASIVRVSGEGMVNRSFGGELLLRRSLIERIGGLVSYTLSRSERLGFADGPSELDRTHVLSTVVSADLGRGFRLGARLFFESGRPYEVRCPTIACAPGEPTIPPPTTDRAAYVARGRMPGFARFDFRLEKRWTFGESGFVAATLEWFNATLSKEADRYEWIARTGGQVQYLSALTIPSIGVEGGY